MKYPILLLCAIALLRPGALAQSPSCCQKATPASGMIALAETPAFAAAHESPETFNYAAQRGSDITFQTLDGTKGRAYYVPAGEATTRILILFHEWWGLNDYIRREADRWQDSLGPVDVYAIDLYDGVVAEDAAQAGRLSTSLDVRRTDVLIKGLLAKAGRDHPIATLGWCLGGSYAFRASVLAEKQAAGCVMYYGFPEKDLKKISPLQTDVLFIHGSRDQFITESDVSQFAAAVKGAGRSIEVQRYDAEHAFANPSNPKHDPAASAAAQASALAFLRKQLVLQ